MKRIRVAQIGCGYWGPNLLRNFSVLPNCSVAYVAEERPERRAYVEANYPGTRAIEDFHQALEDPSIDAIVIATPANTHYDIGKLALEAGKHILVEKPLAMRASEVDHLDTMADARGLVLMVGHTFLFNPAVRYLKDLLDRQELGHVYYAYSHRLNLGVLRQDVNVMWNLAPHDVSILCYLFGSAPITTSAIGADYIQPGIEDVVFMNMEFPGRIRAGVQVSWLDPNKVRRLTIVGSNKMVVYDDVCENKICIYDKGIDAKNMADQMPFDSVIPLRYIQRVGDIILPKIESREPLRIEAEHFLECVREGKRPLTDSRHARDVVETIERAQQSLDEARKCHSADLGKCRLLP